MADRVTANLPSRDLDRTAAFYQALGFAVNFKDDGWMSLSRGPLEIEFFPLEHDPKQSCFSACLRVDDLDALYADFCKAGVRDDCWAMPRLSPPQVLPFGMRMFALVDPDGSLLRCIDNRTTAARHDNV
ncbi:MAG: bleomycin resistance protein [Alphaproteobacteria bacterium]|nr:MAG: bleomycin resistance protein [Alphaproteobacteria bacterium]